MPDMTCGIYLPPKSLPERGWIWPAGLIFRRKACRREDRCGRQGLSSAEKLAGGRIDAAGRAYLPPKNLPERGWTRQAGLIFRRRACRREDGCGRRGLSSAEEFAGERMDAAGGAYLPPKNLQRREDGCGGRGLSSAEELAEAGGWTRQAGLTFRQRTCRGRRMDAAGETYLPPKNLPRQEDGHGRRGLSSAEKLAEARGER